MQSISFVYLNKDDSSFTVKEKNFKDDEFDIKIFNRGWTKLRTIGRRHIKKEKIHFHGIEYDNPWHEKPMLWFAFKNDDKYHLVQG